ncbi:MAG: phosphoadenosine phosphosulfate reductase family protein [Anaerostipes sp.]|nr:phosphoadenosine phosphosulfate reductase family protein [Anaerostipes sp.]
MLKSIREKDDVKKHMYFQSAMLIVIYAAIEYPEVRKFAMETENVTVLKPKMNFKQVLEKYGYPVVSKEQSQYISEYRTTNSDKLKDIRWNGNKWGRGKISKKWRYLVNADFKISNKCCDIMKKNPVKKFEKKTGKHPILGTMCEESALRKSQWMKSGCNGFESTRPISKPMSFWTNQDVLEYIQTYGIEIPSVYGEIVEEKGKLKTTKCDRTGCVFCMYGLQSDKTPNRFQRMKETHPRLYEYCLKPKEDGGLGIKDVFDYMGTDY